jgi:exosortase
MIFVMPAGNSAEYVTFPLRMLATKLSVALSHVLGVDVIQDGSRVFNSERTFEYDVAPACSGIRSLVTFVALSLVYGFLFLKTGWRRLVMLAASVPLAVFSNVVRLLTIILAAEAAGQSAGNYVHESDWLSLILYIPAFGAMAILGWLLQKEHPAARETPAT